MLTDNELKAIEAEFKDWLHSAEKPYPYYAYLAGATAERIKAKKLMEALRMAKKEIITLTDSDQPANKIHYPKYIDKAIQEYNKTP